MDKEDIHRWVKVLFQTSEKEDLYKTHQNWKPKRATPTNKEEATSRITPFRWTTTSPCIINVEDFCGQLREYVHIVRSDKLLLELNALKAVENRMVSIFIVEKKLNRMIKSWKDYNIKVLTDIGVQVRNIMKGKDFPMWDILLPTPEDCVALT